MNEVSNDLGGRFIGVFAGDALKPRIPSVPVQNHTNVSKQRDAHTSTHI